MSKRTAPEYKTSSLARKCGFYCENTGKNTYAQYLAEQMFLLCRGTGGPEHYVSDLYHDFQWAQDHEREYLDAKPGILFVYVVRECGTNRFAHWADWLKCRRHCGRVLAAYCFEKQADGTVDVREALI